MRIIDAHFHWWPRAVFEALCKRTRYPRAARNDKGGFTYWRREGDPPRFNPGPEWLDLEKQIAYMDSLGHQIDLVCSTGPMGVVFSDLPKEEGRDLALLWNEEMAGATRKYPGRIWAMGALPLVDTAIAIEVMEDSVNRLGMVGMSLPGSVGSDTAIDAPRLEPFYARAAELGTTLFLHPTDGIFEDLMEGYNGALYLTLGRVVDVSTAAMRLILSGMMERHPTLKIFMSHTGGALPFQAGRMDKNSKAAKLKQPPSTYIKRMYTDIVQPHAAGMKFAIEFYGVDNVMYGTDYPCWDPAEALKLFDEIGLSKADQQKILYDNARRILNLRDPVHKAVAAE